MTPEEINIEFRMIIGHALLGYEEVIQITKEDWDLVFSECTKFALKYAKEKCKEQRNLCAKEVETLKYKWLKGELKELPPISVMITDAAEPELELK